MTRWIPAVVAIALMLLFLVFNWLILNRQKQVHSTEHVETSVNTGTHPYFPPQHTAEPKAPSPAAVSSPADTRTNMQDLLQTGYLNDNEIRYTPEFGVSRFHHVKK